MATPFPIAYFGSIAYFQTLASVKEVLFETHEHFPKQTFRNRCTILGANGLHLLTLPVIKPNGSKTPTGEILCSDQTPWDKLQWRAIQSAYASAPYFEHYAQDIQALLHSEHSSLVDKTTAITQFFIDTWELPVTFQLSNDFEPISSEHDYRMIDFDNVNSLLFAPSYTQVQFGNQAFASNCSVLDLLFCEGPLGRKSILL